MPDSVTDAERFDRLPKWAQREIHGLRRDLANLRDAKGLANPDESDTFILPGIIGEAVALGRRSLIRFFLDVERRRYIEARLNEGRVELRTGGDRLDVRPRVSNVVTVGFAPEDE